MADYITLLGAEDVRSAGHAMSSAAQEMKRAAGEMSYALESHQRFLNNWLQDFSAVLETAVLKDLKRSEPAASGNPTEQECIA